MSHSTGGKVDAGKRTKRNLEGASKAAATKVPAYEFTAFVLITALIGPGVDASDVPEEWQATLGRALDKFHQMDSSVCILPPLDVPAGKRIYYKSDMPNLWTGWEDYMVHENHNLFNIPTPKDRPRKILSSCMMGFKDEPEKFLARSRTDINRADTGAHSIIFEHKSFQAWHSDRRIMLLNSPTKVPMSSVKDKCHTILSKLEKDLVTKYPEEYRPWQHSGPFPEFDVILDWGREGNWKDPKKRVAGEDTSHRKVPTFVYEKLNEERLIKICTAAKERELEKKAMGQHAFFQVLPEERGSKIDKVKKDQLDDWYITQGGTQKSLGDVILAGLTKPDVKVKVELEEDEAGPWASPGSYTVEEILMKIFSGTTRVFQAILRGYHGHFIGFFSGINANASKMAEEIGEDLASWLKVYLLRRGWKVECVQKLIKESFTPEAADNATKARYCKRTQRVISGAAVKRMEHNKALDEAGIIDRRLGYTESELKELRERELAMECGVGNVNKSEFTAGSFAAFQFGDDMSVQTLNPGKKNRPPASGRSTASSYKLEQESNYSLDSDMYGFGAQGGDDDMQFENLEESDEEEMQTEQLGDREVEVEIPPGGLNSGGVEEDGSEASAILPTDLTGRFPSAGRDAHEEGQDNQSPEEGARQGTQTAGACENKGSTETTGGRGSTMLENMMKTTLDNAGGSNEEKEQFLLAMLARLRAQSPESSAGGTAEHTGTAANPHPPEENADEATASGRGVAHSKDRVPPDITGGNEKPPVQHTGGEGHEAGRKGDGSSDPG